MESPENTQTKAIDPFLPKNLPVAFICVFWFSLLVYTSLRSNFEQLAWFAQDENESTLRKLMIRLIMTIEVALELFLCYLGNMIVLEHSTSYFLFVMRAGILGIVLDIPHAVYEAASSDFPKSLAKEVHKHTRILGGRFRSVKIAERNFSVVWPLLLTGACFLEHYLRRTKSPHGYMQVLDSSGSYGAVIWGPGLAIWFNVALAYCLKCS